MFFFQRCDNAPVSNPPGLGDFADATFEGPLGFFDQLTKLNGLYVLEMFSGVRIHYNGDLLAERIVDLNGNQVLLEYDSELRLRQVTDPVGKRCTFDYDEFNQLRRVRDVEGKREVLYTFGDNGDLEGVDLRPDGEDPSETDYEYAGADALQDIQHNLTRVINPLGHIVLQTEYGFEPDTPSYNRVVRQWSLGRVAPPQSVANDEDNATYDPTVVHSRNTVRQWKVWLYAAHLRLGQQHRITHGSASLRNH